MASFVPTSEATVEDQRLYTEARMVEVACLDCLAQVRVKKNSDHHTSIQWSADSLAQCQERTARRAVPGGRDTVATCARLRASIDAAVREGRVPIGAEDGW